MVDDPGLDRIRLELACGTTELAVLSILDTGRRYAEALLHHRQRPDPPGDAAHRVGQPHRRHVDPALLWSIGLLAVLERRTGTAPGKRLLGLRVAAAALRLLGQR
ncbi:hypothetical protein [Allorhizocola rhizosphaerae]|uniref:hypothetical protein n=1 Tax=Allorhizocola rhizosphaerae TaxID=1872709 RepID=UPI0013C3347F|nr:hypothetical protein [Allorhizocola rhizosphaerae]